MSILEQTRMDRGLYTGRGNGAHQGGGGRELVSRGCGALVWEDEKVLEVDGVGWLDDNVNASDAPKPYT